MSLNDGTMIRRRRGKRAAAQVDRRVDSAGRGFQYRRQDLPPLGRLPTDTEIQITIVRTLTTATTTTSKASTTTTTSRSSTTTISSRSSSSSKSSSLPTSSPLPTSESSSSTSPSPLITVAVPPMSSDSSISASGINSTPSSADSNTTGAVKGEGSLSSGAIAGIAIAVVVVLAALIAFLVRRRMMASRAEKRSDWFDKSGFSAPAPPVMTRSYNPPPPTSFVPSSRPPPAPAPYNYGPPAPASRLSYSQAPVPSFAAASSRPESLIPGRRGPELSAPSVTNVPFQSSATSSPAPAPPINLPGGPTNKDNVLAVRCTFIPSMADELPITTGETIRVLQEYDDGWALCLNDRGQQGMVPMECLAGPANTTSPVDKPGLKRSSSLSDKS